MRDRKKIWWGRRPAIQVATIIRSTVDTLNKGVESHHTVSVRPSVRRVLRYERASTRTRTHTHTHPHLSTTLSLFMWGRGSIPSNEHSGHTGSLNVSTVRTHNYSTANNPIIATTTTLVTVTGNNNNATNSIWTSEKSTSIIFLTHNDHYSCSYLNKTHSVGSAVWQHCAPRPEPEASYPPGGSVSKELHPKTLPLWLTAWWKTAKSESLHDVSSDCISPSCLWNELCARTEDLTGWIEWAEDTSAVTPDVVSREMHGKINTGPETYK